MGRTEGSSFQVGRSHRTPETETEAARGGGSGPGAAPRRCRGARGNRELPRVPPRPSRASSEAPGTLPRQSGWTAASARGESGRKAGRVVREVSAPVTG